MIASLIDGFIVFDLDIDSPWDWVSLLAETFPNDRPYVGCYSGYEDCLWWH